MKKPFYRRLLLKLSGEALAGEKGSGLDPEYILAFSKQIHEVSVLGVQIGIVIGGGNILRGFSAAQAGMDRVAGDHMGMLATVINCMAMRNALEQSGSEARVMSAILMHSVAEPYIRNKAIRHLEKGRIVLFGGGTGNPYFTTDSAATLRAVETKCDIIMKGTKVDGIYDKDPVKHADAAMFKSLTYDEVIHRQISVMDTSSIVLCRENSMPIQVFNMNEPGNLRKAVLGEKIGTVVNS